MRMPARRRGHHRRRRRQNVLGPPRRPARRRAGRRLGPAQHRLARRRRPAQPHCSRRGPTPSSASPTPTAGTWSTDERFPAEKVHVIYNGVDCRALRPARRDSAIRAEAGHRRRRPGRRHPRRAAARKEPRAVPRTAPSEFSPQLPAAQFIVVGDGPKRARARVARRPARHRRRRSLPRLAQRRARTARRVRPGRASPRTTKPAPFRSSKPSASGVPVVAVDVGSVRETVVDGETGRLFPAGDLDAYAAARARSAPRRRQRRRHGRRGPPTVVDRWSLDAMVRGYEQLIEGIYAAKSPLGRLRSRDASAFASRDRPAIAPLCSG